jgi:ankyrin repeat protein
MIQEAINKTKAIPGKGFELLEEVLKDLKNDNNTTIDKQNNTKLTAIHFAAWSGKADIVQALLDRNADINLQADNSFTPLHVALLTKQFNTALLLLSSNKMSQANLEAAVMKKGAVTALAYAQEEEATGDASQKADWQAVINALKAAGAKK